MFVGKNGLNKCFSSKGEPLASARGGWGAAGCGLFGGCHQTADHGCQGTVLH